jgi:5-dehydro-2-deoxygluconokinase
LGAIIDDQYGEELLEQLTGSRRWLARPIEKANVLPLEFIGGLDVGLTIQSWPREHVVKCLIRYDFETSPEIRAVQELQLQRLLGACRILDRELLLEVLPTVRCDPAKFKVAEVVDHLYGCRIFPDWWKVESPQREEEWSDLSATILEHDAECRGVILLGKGVPLDELCPSIAAARKYDLCKGFAVGRSVFQDAVEAWFKRDCDDDQCVQRIEANFLELIEAWEHAPRS